MTIPHRTFLAAAAAALLLTTVAGCGDDDSTASDGAQPDSVTLRLLTHDSFAVSEEVLAAFTDDTGIEVELIPGGDAGTVVNQAILAKGNPQADVLFGIDSTLLTRALDEDLFVPYEATVTIRRGVLVAVQPGSLGPHHQENLP